MKNYKIVIIFLTIPLLSFLLTSCEREAAFTEDVKTNNTTQLKYYSEAEIQSLKDWLTTQVHLKTEELDSSLFPELSFSPGSTGTNEAIINEYFNGIMYLNEATINGTELNYSYDNLIQKVVVDELLDESAKSIILSGIQLSNDFLTSNAAMDFYKYDLDNSIEFRGDPCGCVNLYDAYISYYVMCQAFGNVWGHCTFASTYFSLYNNCLNKEIVCPPGFEFDGANCHSGIYFPQGYNGFILGNGFYTQQNCSISTANNCCPSNFGFDGANCHYWGLYFPSNYESFIYKNAFYVKPKCM